MPTNYTASKVQRLILVAIIALVSLGLVLWYRSGREESPPLIMANSNKETGTEIESLYLDIHGSKVYAVTQPAQKSTKAKSVTVLLLHGMKYSVDTWLQLGTLNVLSESGYRSAAIDLPGYGKSANIDVPSSPADKSAFIGDVIAALRLDRVVIVTPSMSGDYAIPYLPTNKLRALVALAPVGTEYLTEEDYSRIRVPVLVMVGSEDHNIGDTALDNLKRIGGTESVVVGGGSHAFYINNPEVLHIHLIEFLNKL